MSVPVSPTARGMWRSWRGVLLVGLLVLAAALVPALLTPARTMGRPLDPADSSLGGGMALARLLAQHNVTVSRVDSVDDLLAGDGLLLISGTAAIARSDATRIAASHRDRLLAGAVPYMDVLAPGLDPSEVEVRARVREPSCALKEAVQAGGAFIGTIGFSGPRGAIGCYPSAEGPTLVRYASGSATITVVGDASFMTNLRLAEDGNAALALNLAGAQSRVVWLVTPDDPAALPADTEPRSLGELIPDGVNWAILQLIIALVVVAIWRGRRLGPVVAERLPVAVRAAETVEGRARLYRARRARDRAAIALRAATLDRVAPRLGLGRTATSDQVVAATAARTGEDPVRLRSALYGETPSDDAGLVALAAYLDTLERQVRDS